MNAQTLRRILSRRVHEGESERFREAMLRNLSLAAYPVFDGGGVSWRAWQTPAAFFTSSSIPVRHPCSTGPLMF